MPNHATWVVKLGGSLLASGALPDWLRLLEKCRRHARLVVVPGGGPFADTVRETQRQVGFDDVIGHRMALLGMRQMGELICGYGLGKFSLVDGLPSLIGNERIVVYCPSATQFGGWSLPADWRVTSDSIALKIATLLEASGLVLVKSVPPKPGEWSGATLAQRGYVDDFFPVLMKSTICPVHVAGRQQTEQFEALVGRGGQSSRALPRLA